MNIDLFTFIAQIINFIILVFLLYRFLFKKIIRAIDSKEETIRNQFEQAEKKSEEANQIKREHERQIKELNEQKEDFINGAKQEARSEKERLMEEARLSISEKKREWENKLEREKSNFLKNLQGKIAAQVYSTAKSVVSDLANADLQKMISRQFMGVLQTLSEEQKEKLRVAYSDAKGVEVLSSFELQGEEKEEIEQLLGDILKAKPAISYEGNTTAVLGISLKLGGFQYNWTTKNYFEKLQEKFEKVLENA